MHVDFNKPKCEPKFAKLKRPCVEKLVIFKIRMDF